MTNQANRTTAKAYAKPYIAVENIGDSVYVAVIGAKDKHQADALMLEEGYDEHRYCETDGFVPNAKFYYRG